jgi:hypothetical protein
MSLASFDAQQQLIKERGHDFGQAQWWICPHCFDDAHHFSDATGCERQDSQADHRIKIGPTDV